MRTLTPLSFFLMILVLPALANDHTPPAVTPATSFAAVEVHEKEKVAIAVDPYDTKEKAEIFHFKYLDHGVIPVRIIITNLGDRPISLKDARILFETASGERIQAAEPEDVERMAGRSDPRSTLPIPSPIPGIRLKHKSHNKDIEADFNTFEYQALVVEPHTTRAGFLFYVCPLPSPLQGADIYLNKLRNASGEELFPFQIPFDKYLRAKATGQPN